jgi:hypothetical protein
VERGGEVLKCSSLPGIFCVPHCEECSNSSLRGVITCVASAKHVITTRQSPATLEFIVHQPTALDI